MSHAFLAAGLCVGLSGCSDPGIVTVNVKLQRAPANQSEVLATIPKGSAIDVGHCTNGWCRATWNGRDGYVLTKNVRVGRSGTRTGDTEPLDKDDTQDDDIGSVPDSSSDAGPN